MSIKKEMLDKLTKEQLKDIAENKGIQFNLSKSQKKYYKNWDEKDKMVDLMSETEDISVQEIEHYIKSKGCL